MQPGVSDMAWNDIAAAVGTTGKQHFNFCLKRRRFLVALILADSLHS